MELTFGQRISGLTVDGREVRAAVFDEQEVRAAAGLTMVIGAEFGDDTILDDFIARIGMPSGGAVRVSLGLASNFADVYRFMAFATRFCDLETVPQHLPPRLAC